MSGIEQQPCCCEQGLHPCCISWTRRYRCETGGAPNCNSTSSITETELEGIGRASGCYATEEDCRKAYEVYDPEINFFPDRFCDGSKVPENLCPEQPCEQLCITNACAPCGSYPESCAVIPCDEWCNPGPICPDPEPCCLPPPTPKACYITTDGFGCPIAAECRSGPCATGGGGFAWECFEVSDCIQCVGGDGNCVPCLNWTCEPIPPCTCACCLPECSNNGALAPPECCRCPTDCGPGPSGAICAAGCDGVVPNFPGLNSNHCGDCFALKFYISGCGQPPPGPGCLSSEFGALCQQLNLTTLGADDKTDTNSYNNVFLFGYGERFL